MMVVWDVLADAYKVLAALPFIPFLAVYFLCKSRGMEKKKAMQAAADITTFFLVGIVSALLSQLTGSSFGFYFILLVMLIGAGLIGNAQTRIKGALNPRKIIQAVWRLSFFALSILYVLLMSIHLLTLSSSN